MQYSNRKVLLLLEASREYGRGLLRGILGYNSLHEPWFIEWQEPFYLQTNTSSRKRLKGLVQDVDGIIMREQQDNDLFFDLGVPVIFASYLDKYLPGTYRITTNDKSIGVCVAKHFQERGFVNFGYFGYDDMYWSENRKNKFVQELEKDGYTCHTFHQFKRQSERLWNNEQHRAAEWIASLPKPVGVFCCNDERARQARDACRLAQLHVPGEVAIVGADNDEFICNTSLPSLSSVSLNLEAAGYQSAELLDGLMNGDKDLPKQIVVEPSRVAVRQSSDIYAISDAVVSEAIHFIHNNHHRPIQVSDLADHIAISRRTLHDRFKRVVGCTAYSYIKKARVDRIKELLVETDWTITRIAENMGFTSSDHIATYFRSQVGINPYKYRLKYRSKNTVD